MPARSNLSTMAELWTVSSAEATEGAFVPIDGDVRILDAVAEAARVAARADVVVVRARAAGAREEFEVRAAASAPATLATRLEGSRFPVSELPTAEEDDLERMPGAVRMAARRVRATVALQIPIYDQGKPIGSLELLRGGRTFAEDEARAARLAARLVRFALGALGRATVR